MQLFVLTPDYSQDNPVLKFGSSSWGLLPQSLDPDTTAASFTCVSYSWGLGRVPSAFHPAQTVSDRTVPAISSVILQRPSCRNVWIDAFCVPSPDHAIERAATLESMGFIYSRAEEVIVVLTSDALPALEQITRREKLLPSHLSALESEDWVTRAWTYQEAVNATRLRMTCHSAPPGVLIDCHEFLSSLGFALNTLTPEERNLYPRVNELEDLLTDCIVAGYLDRPALQVMAAMGTRTQTRADDHFYAMMGAISTEPAKPHKLLSPCQAFMSLCERKGDYSFIFSSARRDTTPGRGWRPRECNNLPPILSMTVSGPGNHGIVDPGRLRGYLEEGRLRLEDVMVVKPAPVSDDAMGFIERWLVGFKPEGCYDGIELERAAFKALKELRFTGSEEWLTTESGLFYPQWGLPERVEVEIIVAVGIQWRLGSPGLARYREKSSGDVIYVPGVYFGRIGAGHSPITCVVL